MTSVSLSLGHLRSATPHDLLLELSEESHVFFSSRSGTLHAGPNTTCEPLGLEEAASPALAQRFPERLAQGHGRSYVAGAFGFDPAQSSTLFLLRDPAHVDHAQGERSKLQHRPMALLSRLRSYSVRRDPSPAEYADRVTELLRQIELGTLHKAVLARSVEVSFDGGLSRVDFLRTLFARNPSAFIFWLKLAPCDPEPRCLVGASPELLVRKARGRVFTHPLAGSRPRGQDPEEDARLQSELRTSEKDLREHRFVVEAIAERLGPFCRTLHIPERPSLLSTPTMWHLGTPIEGELLDPSCSSLELAQTLHPTPAVCGVPSTKASEWIEKLERAPRGLFAGAVGYCDEHGDGEWAVTLRCAELTKSSLRAWAGAGIVRGSVPWDEVDETSAKLGTILQALGLSWPSSRLA